MRVVRMRRGWKLRLTDNEFSVLHKIAARGLRGVDFDKFTFKERKVLSEDRWSQDPLAPDEDRRAEDGAENETERNALEAEGGGGQDDG